MEINVSRHPNTSPGNRMTIQYPLGGGRQAPHHRGRPVGPRVDGHDPVYFILRPNESYFGGCSAQINS